MVLDNPTVTHAVKESDARIVEERRRLLAGSELFQLMLSGGAEARARMLEYRSADLTVGWRLLQQKLAADKKNVHREKMIRVIFRFRRLNHKSRAAPFSRPDLFAPPPRFRAALPYLKSMLGLKFHSPMKNA